MEATRREALILEHLPLVEKLVRQYAWEGVDKEVLYQEGCYGLILAVDRYVPTKGASLSTFSVYYIRKHILKSIREDHYGMKEKSARYTRLCKAAAEELAMELGRDPSVREIAERTGISYKDVYSYMVVGASHISLDTLMDDQMPRTGKRCVEDEVLVSLSIAVA